MRSPCTILLFGLLLIGCGSATSPASSAASPAPLSEADALPLATFSALFADDSSVFETSLAEIDRAWHPGYAAMLLEIQRFLRANKERSSAVIGLLRKRTGLATASAEEMFRWVWKEQPAPHPKYARFKELLYRQIDPDFAAYFDNHTQGALVRLNEIRWGGVRRDGIPPLKNPTMITAGKADYLDDKDIVFGVEINNDVRAYPKRILAWHEMFKDTVGGEPVNGVYCTLCGSMIVYKTRHRGVHHELGTSGFLYRSNKLMYDEATESLWSTLGGKPVVGPLVGKGIKLEPLPVVTTTWGEWRAQHPATTVLSLETGHSRDYSEGNAYRKYFGTDALMFAVPKLDRRLKNKAEVLVLRFGSGVPTAVSAAYLDDHPIYQGTVSGISYLILTDKSGANRVYESQEIRWQEYDNNVAVDSQGASWQVSESGLTSPSGRTLARLPAHRVFWFGWFALHPNTVLVQ